MIISLYTLTLGIGLFVVSSFLNFNLLKFKEIGYEFSLRISKELLQTKGSPNFNRQSPERRPSL